MVAAVAKVVEATFSVGKEAAGGSAHAIAIGTFDDVGGGGKGGSANGVVLWAGPETEDNQVGHLLSPPVSGCRLGLGDELHRAIQGIFRISSRVTNELGIVAKLAEGPNGKTEIPAPPTRSIPVRQWSKTENFHQNSVAMMRSGG